jgi:hypothetical protein
LLVLKESKTKIDGEPDKTKSIAAAVVQQILHIPLSFLKNKNNQGIQQLAPTMAIGQG